jgi:hypothetical protein
LARDDYFFYVDTQAVPQAEFGPPLLLPHLVGGGSSAVKVAERRWPIRADPASTTISLSKVAFRMGISFFKQSETFWTNSETCFYDT